MSESHPPADTQPPAQAHGPLWQVGRVVRVLVLHIALPAAVLYGGWRGATWLLETAPKTERKARPRTARPVEVVHVETTTEGPRIHALGTVKPARETTVRARVSGPITDIGTHFRLGGFVAPDELLVQIDRTDFELAEAAAAIEVTQAEAQVREAESLVAQRMTALEDARAKLRLEEGQAEVARRELEMLGDEGRRVDRDLVLRVPQRAMAEAAVQAAQAGVESAEAGVAAAKARVAAARHRVRTTELDRKRTAVGAPFAAWIAERRVEKGGYVTPTTDIARLVGTESYYVEVLVPASDVRWLEMPAEGASAKADVELRDEAAWGPDAERRGRLVRQLGELESTGRMARLLVEVDDPLQLEPETGTGRPLVLGSVVRVTLTGRPLASAVKLDRELLRHGDVVWIAAADDTLEIRSVDVAWRGPEDVLVGSGLEPGDRVVKTDLGTPVPGMALAPREAAKDAP
ncbi:MAG: HlyD family efflux transporter periplasmic adaptor subunit [Planctomycetes bacterium]|nr:HlyD family efflux transporter periplasmic adaptor subunit [Planctomycetota bacterium]